MGLEGKYMSYFEGDFGDLKLVFIHHYGIENSWLDMVGSCVSKVPFFIAGQFYYFRIELANSEN